MKTIFRTTNTKIKDSDRYIHPDDTETKIWPLEKPFVYECRPYQKNFKAIGLRAQYEKDLIVMYLFHDKCPTIYSYIVSLDPKCKKGLRFPFLSHALDYIKIALASEIPTSDELRKRRKKKNE